MSCEIFDTILRYIILTRRVEEQVSRGKLEQGVEKNRSRRVRENMSKGAEKRK